MLWGRSLQITSARLEVFLGKQIAFQEGNTEHLLNQIVSPVHLKSFLHCLRSESIGVRCRIVTQHGRQRNSPQRLRYFPEKVEWRHGNDTVATHNSTRILFQRTFGASECREVVCPYIIQFFWWNHGGSCSETISRIRRTVAELWPRAEVFIRTTDDAGWRWSEKIFPGVPVLWTIHRDSVPKGHRAASE